MDASNRCPSDTAAVGPTPPVGSSGLSPIIIERRLGGLGRFAFSILAFGIAGALAERLWDGRITMDTPEGSVHVLIMMVIVGMAGYAALAAPQLRWTIDCRGVEVVRSSRFRCHVQFVSMRDIVTANVHASRTEGMVDGHFVEICLIGGRCLRSPITQNKTEARRAVEWIEAEVRATASA
jgi:hypothetical protein